jgi:7-carboxy-7-deazaguanine synthase
LTSYRLAEVFDTVQGEGAQVGQRMVFVRLSGCNLWNGLEEGRKSGKGDCAAWCDTDFRPRLTMTADELLSAMDALWPSGDRWCCLTGGEPLLQVRPELLLHLRDAGWRIAVETNGTVDVDLALADHLTVSPKKGGALALKDCHALKVVLPGGWSDADLAEMTARYAGAALFVQPQFGNPSAVQECLRVIKRDSRWRLSVQSHKALGIP